MVDLKNYEPATKHYFFLFCVRRHLLRRLSHAHTKIREKACSLSLVTAKNAPHLRLRLRDGKRTGAHPHVGEGKLCLPDAPDDDDPLRHLGSNVSVLQLQVVACSRVDRGNLRERVSKVLALGPGVLFQRKCMLVYVLFAATFGLFECRHEIGFTCCTPGT